MYNAIEGRDKYILEDQVLIDKIEELQLAKGPIAKSNIIKKYSNDENFKKFLYYLLNPMLTYKISDVALINSVSHISLDNRDFTIVFKDIFDVCRTLADKPALSRDDIKTVSAFLIIYPPKIRDVYIGLLSKSLRLGVTNTTVNKIIPGLIPEWNVQQAYPIDKYPLNNGIYFWLTQKLNGVRATYYRGHIYARNGQEYTGLNAILSEIHGALDDEDIVLDGELTLHPDFRGGLSDNEAFRKSTGIINSDNRNADKTCICYTVFDCLPGDEFTLGQSKATYKERRVMLEDINRRLWKFSCDNARLNGNELHIHRNVTVLPVLYQGTDQSKISELLDRMVREDKEGLMVNLDVPYKCKRHNGILKVKRFYTMDLPILRCEEGSGRLAGTLGAFVLDFKGNEVNVGTGFSDEQREEFWRLKDELIGTLCEVKYKEISSDKNTGAESLQFPVYVSLRTDKNTVSYG